MILGFLVLTLFAVACVALVGEMDDCLVMKAQRDLEVDELWGDEDE